MFVFVGYMLLKKTDIGCKKRNRLFNNLEHYTYFQVKKMAERVAKCREEVSKSREKYQSALAEITAYNPRYIEDMTGVFERCQQMEAQRLTFFKDVLFNFHKCLNISQEPT